jgi:hypothetical protein
MESVAEDRPIVSVNIKGGLGNQMFQLACAYAYARKNGGRLLIERNKRSDDGRPLYWDTLLRNFNRYLVEKIPPNLMQWNEIQATEYSQIPPLSEGGIYLNGYLQSSKYFGSDAIRDEIRELFRPSDEMIETIRRKYGVLIENRDRVIVVHARRTDYLRNEYIINVHGPLTASYYKEAVKRMCEGIQNPIFLLVSDDTKFWMDIFREVPEFCNNLLYVLDNENDINTIVLLQQFCHYIIANSTFSWWGAWLSRNAKKVIAPSKWFGPLGPNVYEDIYEESWIRI